MPNQMKIRFWLFRSLRNCSCLAFRPVGNSCHRPKVRMARSISSLIAKSDKQVSRSRTKARYAGPSVLTARLRSQIRIGKYAAAGSRKRPFRYQYHSFGGRISSPQIAQRPYHTSSRKMSCPRRKRVLRRECCRPLRQGYADDPYAARPSCGKCNVTSCKKQNTS